MNDWSCRGCGHVNSTPGGACSSCGMVRESVGDRTIVLPKIDPLMDAPGLSDNVIVTLDDIEPGVPILVVRGGEEEGQFYRLDHSPIALGRRDDSDIVLDDITVSRQHCRISRDGRDFLVEDLRSLNGTYLNQQRVTVARLSHEDELQVGRFRLVFLENPGIQP